jgi:hypothetical protein
MRRLVDLGYELSPEERKTYSKETAWIDNEYPRLRQNVMHDLFMWANCQRFWKRKIDASNMELTRAYILLKGNNT